MNKIEKIKEEVVAELSDSGYCPDKLIKMRTLLSHIEELESTVSVIERNENNLRGIIKQLEAEKAELEERLHCDHKFCIVGDQTICSRCGVVCHEFKEAKK